MKILTATFESALKAHRALFQQRTLGFKKRQLTLLTPASSAAEVDSTPTADGEQPGMGKVIGALVGAASGLWLGALAAVLQPAMLTGWRYVVSYTIGALLGSLSGALAGGVLENLLTRGLPRDELYYYKSELCYGRSVIIVRAERRRELRAGRRALAGSGARSLNEARKLRWIGVANPPRRRAAAADRV